MPTSNQSIDAGSYEWARRRASRVRGFYIHALAFVLGNTANFVINLMTLGQGDNSWWFQWVLLIWGIALAVHAITVFGAGAWLGPAWEERKIRKYMSSAAAASREEQPADRA